LGEGARDGRPPTRKWVRPMEEILSKSVSAARLIGAALQPLSARHMAVMRKIIAKILARWSADWREVLASALGAGLSWVLAQRLLGHPEPIFAAISAIICLSPGLPSHTRQTMGLLLGVATGIVIGELSLALPDNVPMRMILAPFFAMLVASAYGQTAVVSIQAGVSAILIVGFGPAMAGSVRLIDVVIGAAVGLFLSQILEIGNQRAKANSSESDLHLLRHGRGE
jgi:uncharacterized membrane protein YgaE (UPF0421/DUF939 family)